MVNPTRKIPCRRVSSGPSLFCFLGDQPSTLLVGSGVEQPLFSYNLAYFWAKFQSFQVQLITLSPLCSVKKTSMESVKDRLTHFTRTKDEWERNWFTSFVLVIIRWVKAPSLLCSKPPVIMNCNLSNHSEKKA